MDHLQGAGQPDRIASFTADRFAGGQGKDRTQALAACQQAVTHRLQELRSRGGGVDDAAVQRALHEFSAFL